MGEKSLRLRRVLFEGFSLVCLIILFIVIVLTALSTGASLIFVLLGFMPTIVTIILCLIMFDETVFTLVILWILPFVLSGLFFLIATSQALLRANLDIGALVAINIFCSVLFLVIFFVIAKLVSPKEQETPEHKPAHSATHAMNVHQPTTIKEYVASIEDKSKALNFVIGRVYNKYHGGSKQLREKLSLKPELYNEFSEILHNETNPDKKRMLSVLNDIEKQLYLLTLPEKDVITGEQLIELKNLDRNEEGEERIIDVLIKNDKDPVETYYAGAKEFCLKLRDILQ
jgi:hypothetical protein